MKKITLRSALIVTLLSLTQIAFAQRGERGERLDPNRYRDGRDVRAAFRNIVADADKATVRVRCGGKDAALGTIVGADGWILTKASELRDPVVCRFQDGKDFPATLVGVQPSYDLAMLKIDRKDLTPVSWTKTSEATVGELLATASLGQDALAMGVVSVPRRKIPGRNGVLGIQLDESDKGPKITQVFPGSGAEKAGLHAGDIVQRIANQITKSRETLSETVRSHKPGDTVTLSILRGDETLEITATLTLPSFDMGSNGSHNVDQNTMGGPLSVRSADFPLVLQHDTVLRPIDCGGPVCDLSGKVVGVNIARAGRVESYAIPADQITGLLPDLMSGKLAPKEPLAKAFEKKAESPKSETKLTDSKMSDSKSPEKK